MSRSLADMLVRRAVWIILIGVVVAVAGAVAGLTGVRLDADTDSLISPDRPFMQDYQAFKDRFGDLERIWVVVDAHGNESQARSAIDWIEPQLRTLDLPQIVARIDSQEQARLTTWTAPPESVEAIASACAILSLAKDGPDAFLNAAASSLESATSPAGGDLDQRETEVRAAVSALSMLTDAELVPTDQLLTSPSGELHFIGILPHKDYGTLSVVEAPLARIRAVLESAQKRFQGVEIGLTGKPVLQADEMRTTQEDNRKAAVVALVLVSVLVILILREVKRPLLVLVAFAIAVGWTWGFVALAMGRLTLLSIVFLLIMIGVSLDFGVHVVSRHRQLRVNLSLEQTIRTLLAKTARTNLVAAATSIVVFLASLVTDFRGLQELGIIAAVGIALSVVAMTTVLPALLVCFDRHLKPWKARTGVPPRMPARGVVLVLAVVTGALGWVAASDLRFETNLLALQSADLDAARWERRIADDSGAPTWFAAMQAPSLEAAKKLVDRAGKEPAIGRVGGILSVIEPPDEGRDAARRVISNCTHAAEADTKPGGKERVIASLNTLSRLAVGRSVEEAEQLKALAKAIESMSDATLREADDQLASFFAHVQDGARSTLRQVLPEAVARESMAPDGTMLVVVHPAADVWDEAAMSEFVAAARRVDPDVTGVPITHLESLRDMRQGFYRMTIWAALAVAIIMFAESRRLFEPLLCMGVLVIAGGWTLGIATLVGLHLNLANFFAVPVLLGLGVDGAIHMAHRLREGETDWATRRAVLLTSLTTMVGFGSLIMASHRGLASLGALMALGCLACLISALVVVPAALQPRSRTGLDSH